MRFLPILLLPLACSGCLTVRTQHEVKPIHITVDVNLKVQNALNDFFGDLDRKSETIEAAPPANRPVN
jgi:hypothetical protein